MLGTPPSRAFVVLLGVFAVAWTIVWIFMGIWTRAERALETMHECAELGIEHVWMHAPAFGAGSVSDEATTFGREHGIHVIDGGCPCMFGETADVGHRIMRHVPGAHVPKRVH